MFPTSEHRKLAAIMFTDMAGYSALSQRNEALALELLEEHRRIVRDILPRHSGREVKTTGDGFLIEFPSALAAVQCAIDVQAALHTRNLQAGRALPSPPEAERPVRSASPTEILIRIGIHVGDVVLRDGDIHGDGVNIAARIEPLAEPGGICVSEDVARQVGNKIEHSLAPLGPTELKHIELPMVVHRLALPWLPGGSAPAKPTGIAARLPRRRPGMLAWSAGVAALVLTVVLAAWWIRGHRPAEAERRAIRSIAVGFSSDSPDRDQQAWARVMTELLVSHLTRIQALDVRQLPAPKESEDATQAALEQGRRLQVNAVLRGSVRCESNEVLIIPALVEVASGRVLWSGPHRRRLGEVPDLQEELARDIAKEIRLTLTPGEQARLAQRSTENPAAMKAYLRGRASWVRGDEAGYSNAVVRFNEAIALDPNFALAYAGLSDAWLCSAITHVPPAQAYPQAKAAARRALELQEDLADAHVALGMTILFDDWDWQRAERHITRAIELAPDSAQARDGYSCFLAAAGRLDAAVRQGLEAVRRNPLAPGYYTDLAQAYLAKGDLTNAWTQAQAALELDPANPMPHLVLGYVHMLARRYGEAEQAFREGLRSQPDDPLNLGGLGASLAAQNRRVEALEVVRRLDDLEKVRFVPAWQAACTFTHLGDFDEAFARLERAVRQKENSVPWLRQDVLLIPLRSDPRFEVLARRIGIPP